MSLGDEREGQMKSLGYSYPEDKVKKAIKEEWFLIIQLKEKVITWKEFIIERMKIFGRKLTHEN